MDELVKNLRAIDWYGIAALAAIAFGILKSIISGWASGRRQERNDRFAREARETDITPVTGSPGERTRIQAMEENQHRVLAGIAAIRSDLSAAIAAIERVEGYLHKEIQCLKDKLNRLA